MLWITLYLKMLIRVFTGDWFEWVFWSTESTACHWLIQPATKIYHTLPYVFNVLFAPDHKKVCWKCLPSGSCRIHWYIFQLNSMKICIARFSLVGYLYVVDYAYADYYCLHMISHLIGISWLLDQQDYRLWQTRFPHRT